MSDYCTHYTHFSIDFPERLLSTSHIYCDFIHITYPYVNGTYSLEKNELY